MNTMKHFVRLSMVFIMVSCGNNSTHYIIGNDLSDYSDCEMMLLSTLPHVFCDEGGLMYPSACKNEPFNQALDHTLCKNRRISTDDSVDAVSDIWRTYAYLTSDNSEEEIALLEDSRIEQFISSVKEYSLGREDFPVETFRSLLSSVCLSYANYANHGRQGELTLALAMQFIAERGLSELNSIQDIADICTEDGKAGIFFIPSGYNSQFDQSLILFQPFDGICTTYCSLWHASIQEYDNESYVSIEQNKYDHVLQIEKDEQNYYLFYCDSPNDAEGIVYFHNGKEIEMVPVQELPTTFPHN